MQQDTFMRYSHKNTPKHTHKTRKQFFPDWKQQKPGLLNRKPVKNTKLEFFKDFSQKMSSVSRSVENPKESSMLAKSLVSSKIEGGFDKKKLETRRQLSSEIFSAPNYHSTTT